MKVALCVALFLAACSLVTSAPSVNANSLLQTIETQLAKKESNDEDAVMLAKMAKLVAIQKFLGGSNILRALKFISNGGQPAQVEGGDWTKYIPIATGILGTFG